MLFAGLGFLLLEHAPSGQIMGDAGYLIGLWFHTIPMLAGVTAGLGMRWLGRS